MLLKKVKHFRKTCGPKKYNHFYKNKIIFLQQIDHILILKADKRKKTPIMLKTEYEIRWTICLKISQHVEMEHPTTEIKDFFNQLVLICHKSGFINFGTKKLQTCYNGHAPYINGLPKIHDTVLPLISIVKNIDS